MGRIARLSDELVVSLERGGAGRIRVADGGCGMGREDALLAIERHATSKQRGLQGLFAIRTMGFHGEALPSIAAVSRFSLATSEREAAVGTCVPADGGAKTEVEDAAPVGGTVVEVEDLFFVRRAGRDARRPRPARRARARGVVAAAAGARGEGGGGAARPARPGAAPLRLARAALPSRTVGEVPS